MIFLDYLMPEMDGIETLQQAKALDGNLSRGAVVIALTANALSGAKEMFLEKGFCDFLSKPIMWEELEEMFVRYLPDRCSFVQQETAPEQPKTPQQQTLQPQNPQQEGSLVDWERGLKYCMDNSDFYREMLRLFLDGHAQDLLQELYEQGSWEDYRIKIHAMKTNLANIGAEHTSELAKSIELALKHENDISFAQENHEGFLAEYQIVVSEVEKYLAS
jgi:CheY-like chemotaxis protein